MTDTLPPAISAASPANSAPTPCPTPTKRAFPTKLAAHARLANILANPQTQVLPNRVYECECGAFHLAHVSARAILRPTPLSMAHLAAERRNQQERAAQ